MLPNNPTKWDEIYLLPSKVICNTYLRRFQYKVLDNTLLLNNKLYRSKLTNSPVCSFCNETTENETTLHIFYSSNLTRRLLSQLKLFLERNLILPYLLPQTSIFGFLDETELRKCEKDKFFNRKRK